MATITLNIPDAALSRVVDALCARGNWRDVETDGPKGAFAKRELARWLREEVHRHERAETLAAVTFPEQVDIN